MGAPKIKDFLDNESKIFYEGLKQTLNNLKISYEENQNLVRGLIIMIIQFLNLLGILTQDKIH